MNEKQIESFWNKVNIKSENECWEWNAGLRTGYGVFKVNRKSKSAHRLSYLLSYNKDPGELYVCHKCDNRKCVNPNHLFLGTQSDNMKDCYNKGRMYIPIGNRFEKGNTPLNVLINNELALIIYNIINNRRNNKEKLNLKELGIQYNIPYTTIRDISCGRTYINKLN